MEKDHAAAAQPLLDPPAEKVERRGDQPGRDGGKGPGSDLRSRVGLGDTELLTFFTSSFVWIVSTTSTRSLEWGSGLPLGALWLSYGSLRFYGDWGWGEMGHGGVTAGLRRTREG